VANREVANAALAAMKVAKLAAVHDEHSLNRIFPSVGEDLLDCALEWKDVDFWHEVFINSGGSLKALISALRRALVVFHVGVLQDRCVAVSTFKTRIAKTQFDIISLTALKT
jgi:hypothetical protein